MIITMWRETLRPLCLGLILSAFSLGASATPASADIAQALYCLFYGCDWDDEEEVEHVDPTGVIHTVFIVGDAFFPEEIHASPGDELKFYNLRSSSIRVKADDGSWTSTNMSKNQSWSLILQADTELQFRKNGYSSPYMYGEVFLEDPPASVAFGDLIDPSGNVIGKGGEVAYVASGLGRTLAGVSGNVQDVGQGLGNLLGLGN
ncbi:hypothetical protein [Pseudooceanicola sp.]|uniref:hypothetical protein n=1 Tax=Pseudooceanicola sp. TaxID=1914328 RepID=UPI0035C77716